MKNGSGIRLRLAFYVILALGLVFIMIFGEKISPYDPYKNNLYAIDMAPCREHLMGTYHHLRLFGPIPHHVLTPADGCRPARAL